MYRRWILSNVDISSNMWMVVALSWPTIRSLEISKHPQGGTVFPFAFMLIIFARQRCYQRRRCQHHHKKFINPSIITTSVSQHRSTRFFCLCSPYRCISNWEKKSKHDEGTPRKHTPQGSEIAACRVSVVIYHIARGQHHGWFEVCQSFEKKYHIYIRPSLGLNQCCLENMSSLKSNHEVYRSFHNKVDANIDSSYKISLRLISQVSIFLLHLHGHHRFDNDSDSFMSRFSYSRTTSHISPKESLWTLIVNSIHRWENR